MSDDPAKNATAAAPAAEQVANAEEEVQQQQEETPAVPAPNFADGEFHCMCGKCGFTVTGAPVMSCFCHCNKCLSHIGTAFQAALYTPDKFSYTEGTEENLNKYESAPGKFRLCCKTCGSVVNAISPTGAIVTPLGGIKFKDNGVPVRPTMHIFTGDDDATPILDDLPQFKEWPM